MTRDDVLKSIQTKAAEILDVEESAVVEAATFRDDLDADSLDLVELIMALEEELDVSIPEEEIEGVRTVGDAVGIICETLAVTA
jgi:acyl carrier protein